MAVKRTDEDRRAAARLSDLIAARARLQHALDLKRCELAAEVRRMGGGWHTPLAAELDQACRVALRGWEDAAAAAVSVELTAQRQLKELKCGKSN
jgi:hypothetical protein